MTRLKLAELTSGMGALVLGVQPGAGGPHRGGDTLVVLGRSESLKLLEQQATA